MDRYRYQQVADIAFTLNADLPLEIQSEIFEEGLRELRVRPTSIENRKILLVGGAGYIGSVVTGYLLQCGYYVRILDAFLYQNSASILPFFSHERCEFLFGDFTVRSFLEKALEEVTDVIILGGLVGDPITKKYPVLSDHINLDGVSQLIKLLNQYPLNKVVFISTCSNYGLIEQNVLADEKWPLKPLSLYAKAKVEMEELLLSQKGSASYCPVILRFATAFGLSSRMRFDLTVNEFVKDLYFGKELLVYDHDTWRPYCHVLDFALALRRVLEAPLEKVSFEVFNAGSEKNNYTKQMIIEEIKRFLPDAKINYQKHGPDPRNYRVSFRKIREVLHFEPRYNIAAGVGEILSAFNKNLFVDLDSKPDFYGNYHLDYAFSSDKQCESV